MNNNKLSDEEVLVGLLDYGIFAEKIPPCFTSQGLAGLVKDSMSGIINEDDDKKLEDEIKRRSHDYIRYEALRDVNIPRHLGIPHPESYALQALSIMKNWQCINNHLERPSPKISRIFPRHVGGGRIFEMNYKGDERYQLEEDEIQWNAGAQFLVKTDISSCFPSIYTHSIPWALHGRPNAKNNRGINTLIGNLLDKCTQCTRDMQTNGLLIGPHASNIISEIVLTNIDNELLSKGYKKLKRHIDDYEFYADSCDEAESFLKDLGMSLRKYELSINEKKTKILSLPRSSTDNWTQELNRFVFYKDEEVRFSTVRSFLDLALECALAAGTSAPINYAIKVLSDNHNERPLNQRAKRLYVQETINLALAYPYLAPVLDTFVFDKYWHDGISIKIKNFSDTLIRLGIRKLYPDAIAHGFYYAMKYAADPLPLSENDLLEIMNIDDCIVNVLLLEYSRKHNLNKVQKKINKHAAEFKKRDARDRDKQWLLIYHAWSMNDLMGNNQKFLAELKEKEFKFLIIPES